MPTASVIIPNLHSPHLGELLKALKNQTILPLEVIVVGQDKYNFVQSNDWVRFCATDRPIPPALARNVGLAYARGDLCCYLDADCVPKEDWLEQLLIQQQHGRAVVGGGIALGNETFWQRCDNIASMGPFLITASEGKRAYLITANVAFRRDLLRRFGGFDPGFLFPASEDTDLAFRFRREAVEIFFNPKAIVVHRTSRKSPKAIWQHIWLYGYQWPYLQQRFTDLIGISLWERLATFCLPLALLLIPFLALHDTYQIYAQQIALFKQHWPTFPVVCWARMAWYVGRLDYFKAKK